MTELTRRQQEAWELRQEGLLFKQIAPRMHIGTSAAHRLVRDARRALDVQTQHGLWAKQPSPCSSARGEEEA